jgi:hypothetical protein
MQCASARRYGSWFNRQTAGHLCGLANERARNGNTNFDLNRRTSCTYPKQLSIACESVDNHGDGRSPQVDFADLVGSRITAHGPPVRLNAAAAQAIGLAIHELSTNAGKYGALSVDTGCVDVAWRLEGEVFCMSWIERDGPPVSQPKRQGFGSMVVDPMVKQTVNGEIQLDYALSGVAWNLTCPAANALERNLLYKNSESSRRPALTPRTTPHTRQLPSPTAH